MQNYNSVQNIGQTAQVKAKESELEHALSRLEQTISGLDLLTNDLIDNLVPIIRQEPAPNKGEVVGNQNKPSSPMGLYVDNLGSRVSLIKQKLSDLLYSLAV